MGTEFHLDNGTLLIYIVKGTKIKFIKYKHQELNRKFGTT